MNEKPSENKEDKVKYQALIDNTAQGIFNYLKEIENKREIYEKRWIWELLQNALDATPQDRKIEIKIIRNNNKLTFAHNGRPFKPEEVAHLIYHGSTKREDDIGKFGTGFLVTHLLSKKVNVKGVRDDSKKFDFELDRNASSADDIKKLMEETWERYQNSLHLTDQSSSYTAEYEYSLNDISEKSAKEGIEALAKIAPYVLAFNDKLGTVEVSDQNGVLKFKLVRESSNSSYITKIVKEIKQEKEGEVSEEHELWIATSDEIEIAVKAKKQDDENYQIENLHDIPKIFTAFPLFGTEDMPFPVVVNSRKFEPTEKRDGIFIGKEDTPDIKRNKNILENAGNLFIKMIKNSDFNRWENVHILLNLTPPPVKDWLGKDWFINLLKNLINEVMNVKVFKTADGNFTSPKECLVPIIGDFEGGKGGRFWNLCYQFTPYKDKIPANTLASEWARIFQNWKLLGICLAEKEITIEKLAAEIAKCKNLQNFKSNLTNSIDELNFLNAFYELLLGAEKRSLLDNICILPDQNGNLKKNRNYLKMKE